MQLRTALFIYSVDGPDIRPSDMSVSVRSQATNVLNRYLNDAERSDLPTLWERNRRGFQKTLSQVRGRLERLGYL